MAKRKTHEWYLMRLKEKGITRLIPTEQYIKSDVPIFHKCTKCSYEYKAAPNNVLNGISCPACDSNQCILGYTDMWTTAPEQAKLLLNPDDGYLYTKASGHRVDWVCPECGSIVPNKSICAVWHRGLKCQNCNDGNSIPNKFFGNVLSKMGIMYEVEKMFPWNKEKRFYDFYIPCIDTIIEIHGGFHYFDNSQYSNASLNEVQENDIEKRKNALENGISQYIVIDCRYSELEWMTKSILECELNEHFDFSDVDFTSCFQVSLKSNVIKSIDMWNTGMSVNQISSNLKVAKGTVNSYLHTGVKLGICDYRGKDEKKKKVICTSTGMIFGSSKEAAEEVGIKFASNISRVCRGERKHVIHPITKEKLLWEFYDGEAS